MAQSFLFLGNFNSSKILQPLFKLDHTILIWPVFLWIAISPKLDYFFEIWFQITNPSSSGIRLPKFRLKISIHFGEIAIYKSGRNMSINWSNLNRGCMLFDFIALFSNLIFDFFWKLRDLWIVWFCCLLGSVACFSLTEVQVMGNLNSLVDFPFSKTNIGKITRYKFMDLLKIRDRFRNTYF